MKPQRTRISAYALIHDANRILLCRLSKEIPRWEGFWTLPGGGLDFGEHPEKAVVREVEEETGLVVEVRSIATVDSIHDTSSSEDFHGIRIIYHVDVVGGLCDMRPPAPPIVANGMDSIQHQTFSSGTWRRSELVSPKRSGHHHPSRETCA